MSAKKLLAVLLVSTTMACANLDKKLNWTYTGATGVQNWGNMFETCKGKEQSPIDIWSKHHSNIQDLKFDYRTYTVINNGHTVQYNYEPVSHMSFMGDDTYKLVQFHFHVPSEHTLDGKQMAMGAHLVHKNEMGELAVVGILFKEGKRNETIDKLWKHFPKTQNIAYPIDQEDIDIQELLPANLEYYHYMGSLTTPPCTENVKWIVMRNTVTASKEQIARFKSVIGGFNSRPIQRSSNDIN